MITPPRMRRTSTGLHAGITPRKARDAMRATPDETRAAWIAEQRVGDQVTPVALPHHRTCGSAYGGSRSALEALHRIEQRHQPHSIEPGLRKGGVHVGRARIPPRATPVGGRAPCPLLR